MDQEDTLAENLETIEEIAEELLRRNAEAGAVDVSKSFLWGR